MELLKQTILHDQILPNPPQRLAPFIPDAIKDIVLDTYNTILANGHQSVAVVSPSGSDRSDGVRLFAQRCYFERTHRVAFVTFDGEVLWCHTKEGRLAAQAKF